MLRIPSLRIIVAVCACPFIGASAQATKALVEIDHPTGAARLIVSKGTRADTAALGEDLVVRLSPRIPIEVVLVNTNTALYAFSKQAEDAPHFETQTVRSFMGRLNPYVPELRAALTRAIRSRGVALAGSSAEEMAAAREALALGIRQNERVLLAVDSAIQGPNGVQQNETAMLLALEQMRRRVSPEQASLPLRSSLGLGAACQKHAGLRLPMTERLLTALANLVQTSQSMHAALDGPAFADDPRWASLRDTALLIDVRVQRALADIELLAATAYRIERLVGVVAGACSRWSAGVASATLTNERHISVRVEPRAEPELSRLTDGASRQFTVAVRPRATIRPALALSAVAIPGARFPRYDTRPATSGVEIYESGLRDARFALGGALGFTWSIVDRRETSGTALWLPQIVVTAGNARGAGIGGGISWNFIKVATGAIWVQHEALDGARAGDVIPDRSRMKTVERFGGPMWYLSLSVFDAAPFAGRLPKTEH
jgi:hypothetical protein